MYSRSIKFLCQASALVLAILIPVALSAQSKQQIQLRSKPLKMGYFCRVQLSGSQGASDHATPKWNLAHSQLQSNQFRRTF